MAADDERHAEWPARTALIVGGAGFIGSRLADVLLGSGWRVRLLDNLTGLGSEANLDWLQERHRALIDVAIADADDWIAVSRQMTGAELAFHLVAADPRVGGPGSPQRERASSLVAASTVFDAAAAQPERPGMVVASTDRAYGPLREIELRDDGARFEPVDPAIAAHGIDETHADIDAGGSWDWQALTDRYLLARARREGLTLTVLRLGSVYGPRQPPLSPDDWIADHLSHVLARRSPLVDGDPRRVRDILHVHDAVDALVMAAIGVERLAGQLFNVGGGAQNALSVFELHALAEQLAETSAPIEHRSPACVDDQRWYVSDHRRFSARTGWQPGISASFGLALIARSLSRTESPHRFDRARS
jgi:CDP-paratose 2-epimerase